MGSKMCLQYLLLLMMFVSSKEKSINLIEIIGSPTLRTTFYRCSKALEATEEEKEAVARIQDRCIGQHGGVSGILARISEENSSTRSGEFKRAPPSGLADVLVSAHRSETASDIKNCIELGQGFLMPNGTFDDGALKGKALRRAEGSDVEEDIKLAIELCEIDDGFERITEFLRCVAVRCAGYEQLVTSTDTTTESYDEAYIDLMNLEPSDIGVPTQRMRNASNFDLCIEIGSLIAQYQGTFNNSAFTVEARIVSSVEGLKIEEITKLAVDLCETAGEFNVVQLARCVILHCTGNDQLVAAAGATV